MSRTEALRQVGATAQPSTRRPLAPGAPVEVALILFAVSQRASPLSTLTWWAPSSVHEKGSVKIIRGVAVRSVRPCCVQNPHRWGLSWAVPAWAYVRACVRVCTCVCKCARAPKSGRASLHVSLLTSVFPRISESKP